jgi:UDP-N-acetylmuramoylalanine--D-glutamate ligase
MSSFQLWDLQKSPHVAVVLMIEPDHLNVHEDLDDYIEAKAHIRRYQTLDDFCVYHPTNAHSRRIAMTGPLFTDDETRVAWEARAGRYGISDDNQAYVKDEAFYIGNERICGVEALQLPGAHNLENACAAISAAWHFAQDIAAVEQGLREFTGLPHRLKLVAEVAGVRYFDDSIATTPGSAIAAIRAFTEPKVLILGGSNKGSDYRELVNLCKVTATKVVAVGETGADIAKLCEEAGVTYERVEDGMTDIVATATDLAAGTGVVILSPAAASFDMFANYGDRGDQFAAAARSLKS